jgi:hypothetical protein
MLMNIIADNEKLSVEGIEYRISNNVRTIRDGSRKSSEVIFSIPDNLPYDPQPFPKGIWNITGVEWQKAKGFDYNTYGPVKIRTDAFCVVDVWELDSDGDYYKQTNRQVKDSAYLLHWSRSITTLGCIRLNSPMDAEKIAAVIQQELDKGSTVQIEVI